MNLSWLHLIPLKIISSYQNNMKNYSPKENRCEKKAKHIFQLSLIHLPNLYAE